MPPRQFPPNPAPPPIAREWFSIKQLAGLLGITERGLIKFWKENRIPPPKHFGKSTRWSAAVVDLIQRLGIPPVGTTWADHAGPRLAGLADLPATIAAPIAEPPPLPLSPETVTGDDDTGPSYWRCPHCRHRVTAPFVPEDENTQAVKAWLEDQAREAREPPVSAAPTPDRPAKRPDTRPDGRDKPRARPKPRR